MTRAERFRTYRQRRTEQRKANEAKAAQMWQDGHNVPAIAKAMGCSGQTVRRWIENAGVYSPRKPYTLPTRRRVLDAIRAGASMSRTARETGVPYATVVLWCRQDGVQSRHASFTAPEYRYGDYVTRRAA